MRQTYPYPVSVKGWLAGVLLCICQLPAVAQQFNVRTFRMLPNDITAYIEPVRDLNQEACALIKVVGDRDFVFSTPLGIVQRRNDVGEIWLYVPHGSVMLTIKHPQWGVLRDYRFSKPLESRMTYELVITTPIVISQPTIAPMEDNPIAPDTLLHYPSMLSMYPTPRCKRPRERLRSLLLVNIGIRRGSPSVGLRAGVMRRHGAYVLIQGDFHSMPHTDGDCNREGISPDGNTPYYTGHTEEGRRIWLAGGIHRIVGDFCLYEGIGYGKHTVGWETVEGRLLRNTSYSSRGISAEIGGIQRFRKLVLSAGVLTIAASYWEATVGIGFNF